MRIKQRKVSMVKISSAVEDVFDKLGGPAIFDDNGGDPDGVLWLVPEDDLSTDAVLDLVRAGDVDIVEGDIVEYDGRGRTRAILDAAYPDGWCGFSSRGEAYGWQAKRPTDFDWSETIEWLEAHPDASPGGHDDLFDMPLPDGFQEANQLFIEGEEWGWDGSAKTGGWEIGKSGWIVEPSIAEIWSVFE